MALPDVGAPRQARRAIQMARGDAAQTAGDDLAGGSVVEPDAMADRGTSVGVAGRSFAARRSWGSRLQPSASHR